MSKKSLERHGLPSTLMVPQSMPPPSLAWITTFSQTCLPALTPCPLLDFCPLYPAVRVIFSNMQLYSPLTPHLSMTSCSFKIKATPLAWPPNSCLPLWPLSVPLPPFLYSSCYLLPFCLCLKSVLMFPSLEPSHRLLFVCNPWTTCLIPMHPSVLSSNITPKGTPLWYPHLQAKVGPHSIYTTVLTGFILNLLLPTSGESLPATQLVYYSSVVRLFFHLICGLPFCLQTSQCLLPPPYPQLMTLLPISSDCFYFLIESVHTFLS